MKHLLHSPLPSPPLLHPPPPPLLLPSSTTTLRRTLLLSVPLLNISSSSLVSAIEPKESCNYKNTAITKTAFVDVAIDGQPIGRIVIGLFGEDAPVGSSRIASLFSGSAGISYRRKEFIKILPNYVQHAGVRSYGVDAELAARTGSSTEAATDTLLAEWQSKAKNNCINNATGSVGIVVRDPLKPPPKVKIVAKNGKLKVEEEEVGKDPNGTEFVIVTKDSPELDESVLVVGKVVEGMDVVERIGKVKTVQENTSSPYFRAAKFIGDKRAVVAERGFNRPYSKVVITNCGILD